MTAGVGFCVCGNQMRWKRVLEDVDEVRDGQAGG